MASTHTTEAADPAALSPRRRQILEAALTVLAEQGMRGLTHRAVDREADLPQGSTSAYLRTRKALQCALGEFVSGQLTADVARLADALTDCLDDPEYVASQITQMFLRWLADRRLLLAKMELGLEATRDPDLLRAFESWRPRLLDIVEDALSRRKSDAHAGPRARAEALVAGLDGVLLGALQRPQREQRAFVEDTLRLMVGPIGDA